MIVHITSAHLVGAAIGAALCFLAMVFALVQFNKNGISPAHVTSFMSGFSAGLIAGAWLSAAFGHGSSAVEQAESVLREYKARVGLEAF